MAKLAPTQRIVDVIRDINKREYQLPSIQRSFVWDKDRIVRLLDSIMCEYPIGAVMVWKPDGNIRCRPFLDQYDGERPLSQLPAPSDAPSYMVLDGQQRLQSLYLAFRGSYDNERAYLRIDSKLELSESDIHFRFDFLDDSAAKADPRWVHLGELEQLSPKNVHPFAISRLPTADTTTLGSAVEILTIFVDAFAHREALLFQEVGSNLDYNDVLEIFERVNSGGIALSKSDLLFSTLTLKLPDMEERFIRIVDELNDNGRHDFNTDFVIKAAFVLLNKGAKYDFRKLQDRSFMDALSANFEKLEKVFTALRAWLDGKALIKASRFLRSKNALIPILDYMLMNSRFQGPNDGAENEAMRQYLYMSMFMRLYSHSPDSPLDQIHSILIEEHKTTPGAFPHARIAEFISARSRKPYQFDDEFLHDLDVVLNIVDAGVSQLPQKRGWSLEKDHIFPRNQLSLRNITADVDDIGNLRLEPKSRNISKSDRMPDGNTEFFGQADVKVAAAYTAACQNLDQASFSMFVAARKAHIRDSVAAFLGL